MNKFRFFSSSTSLFVFVFWFNCHAADPLTLPFASCAPSISALSRAILHLLYITQRLKPSLQFMQKELASDHLEQQCAHDVVDFFSGTSLIKTELVQDILTGMKATSSLRPLLHLWSHIQQFRYGIHPEEKQIILDFAKVYLISYQSLLFKKNRDDSYSLPKITPHELASLEQIEQIFEKIEEYTLSYHLKQYPNKFSYSLTNRPFSHLNQELSACFAFRFYLNKRLHKAFKMLTELQEHNVPVFSEGVQLLGFTEGDLLFTDRVIHCYFETARQTQSLAPIVQLIGQFQSFDFIKSSTFVKEFLVFLSITYKDLHLHTETSLIKAPSHLLEELNELSIEQLLESIDAVTEKFHLSQTLPHVTWFTSWWHGVGAAAIAGGITYLLNRKSPSPSPSIHQILEKEYGIDPDTFTNLVFRRYYFVKRLDEVIKVLLFLSNQHQITHKTNLPLKPLPMAWQDFVAYKDLTNPLLIEDFTQEIRVLSAHFLLTHAHGHYTHILQNFLTKDAPLAVPPTADEEAPPSQLAALSDLTPSIEINKVILRFYHVRRLETAMAHLLTLSKKNLLPLPALSSTFTNSPCFASLHFEQTPIVAMLHSLELHHSPRAFFSLWNDLQRYKYIHDEKVFKEFARFVTHLTHSTLSHRHLISTEKSALLPLEQLHNMPLEDILNLLDLLVEELPGFLEKTELDSHSLLTWKQWLQKYWLIGPISAAIFGIKLYMMYKGIMERPHHPSSGDPAPI